MEVWCMPGILFSVIDAIVSLLMVLIFIRAIISWVPEIAYNYRRPVEWLDRVTSPFTEPFAKLVPPSKAGGIDFSPLFAVVALQIIRKLLFDILVR
ncbi:MAG TPA: hypothetical protein DCL60_01695 [Armatimonadetes bacterium]|jgi:YggT family protein|nr:hypothetical protein [Armatimonadota bacterium]